MNCQGKDRTCIVPDVVYWVGAVKHDAGLAYAATRHGMMLDSGVGRETLGRKCGFISLTVY